MRKVLQTEGRKVMTEIEAIKQRHSVRQYIDKRIEQEKVEQLKAFIAECNEAGNINMQFIEDAEDTYNRLLNRAMGLGSAPSVILCVGPDDETVDERIGYYGEKVVLFAQRIGLNTCWAGTFNRKNTLAEVNEGEKLVISIAIGYGENNGKHRKSKPKEQVIVGHGKKPSWFNYGVEMALMAPTAINQQKFAIKYNEDDESVEIIDKGGIMGKVDKGIVKYHFEIGAEYAKRRGAR